MILADHHHATDHQRAALPFPLIEELGQPDRTAGAADIRDLHPLHRAGRAQHLLDRARGLIPAAAPGAAGTKTLSKSIAWACERPIDRNESGSAAGAATGDEEGNVGSAWDLLSEPVMALSGAEFLT